MMSTSGLHPVARDYLARLTAESRVLTPDAQGELLADITDHLTTALGDNADELAVRNLIERLGTPAELIAAAGPEAVLAPGRRPPALEITSLVLLVVSELLVSSLLVAALALWLLGVVLAVVSREWRPAQKATALAVLGIGFPLAYLLFGLGLAPANAHGLVAGATALVLLGQVVIGVRLIKRRP